MKKLFQFLTFACLGALASLLLGPQVRWLRDPSPSAPTREKIQELAALVTLRVDVAEVLETHLRGYVGGARAVLLVRGDVLIGTDLGKARMTYVDHVTQHATLVLPEPQLIGVRIDHERTRLFTIDSYGVWRLVPFDLFGPELVNQAAVRAQRLIAQSAGEDELRRRSRAHAEAVLAAFCAELRWNVTLQWEPADN